MIAVMGEPPKIPHELFIDLDEAEGSWRASLCIQRIDSYNTHAWMNPVDGILLSADLGAHGADLHLSWEHVRQLRDTLTRLLHEAGHE
jgi:hypothetical protein